MSKIARGDLGSKFDLVAIAASAGSYEPLIQIMSALPADFDAAIIIVQHLYQPRPEVLSHVLQRRTKMPVRCVENGERLARSTIYTVQPGYYPLVGSDLQVTLKPVTKHLYNTADLMFGSVSLSCQKRAIGVVLSGLGSDGARGVRAIKGAQGRVLAQDERTSAYFEMPAAAISTGCVDFVLPPKKIASALVAFVMVNGAAELFKVPLPSWALVIA
jgi:two-component system chemotaxis response regulator CheB